MSLASPAVVQHPSAIQEAASPRLLHLLLALANFSTGLAAFAVIGVLVPISKTFAIDMVTAGWLMSVYAIVYAISSPLVIASTGGMDRRQVLIGGLSLLTAGAVLGALAPSYTVLLASRAVMAIGGGLITPVAASIAIATGRPEQRGKTLATVYGGLTLAQAAGVPLAVWLGYAFGWRITFACAAVFAALSVVVLARAVPRGIVVPRTSLRTLGSVLTAPRLLVAVAFSVLFMSAVFAMYTYLASFLEARYAFGRTGVTTVLLVFGAGAVLGNGMGGFLTDRFGPVRTLAALCMAQMLILPTLTLTHLPVLAIGALIGLWSVMGWSFNVPQQARLATLDPAKAPVLISLHAAAIYVGSSVGSAIGGKTLAQFGHAGLGPLGAALAALALLSLAFARQRR